MAYKNFTHFQTRFPLLSSDYFIGYQDTGACTEEFKVPFTDVLKSVNNFDVSARNIFTKNISATYLSTSSISASNIFVQNISATYISVSGISASNIQLTKAHILDSPTALTPTAYEYLVLNINGAERAILLHEL